MPIKAGLQELFPTLLAKGAAGMPQLTLKVDNANGTLLRCEKPLRVSKRYGAKLIVGGLCFVGWPGCRWTQRGDGSF